MLVSEFNYDLPEERIAKFPPEERGTTRLLVLDRHTGAITDGYYRNLDDFLNPGDVLILNDTRVMQSRLFCALHDGHPRELVVLEKHGDEPQRVMYRGKLHEGDTLEVLKDQSFSQSEGVRSAAARGVAPAARGDGPAGRGPRKDLSATHLYAIIPVSLKDGRLIFFRRKVRATESMVVANSDRP